ncbi:hypothetical protein M409DRAFT_49023 [Zasmidium cellare ATCC 36951]|uniref:DUF3824 domain-containing protein n=1 Tax=Zasmidium cellare ATCC 36951 TaxID=1080233 RepID=A0A6A6D928_ZASCE|nr:uncharacterized protein M409DRAFT_49023 [Zasmidium cellare ATCC 36951]KAF2174156.1 hypothetical protein M409DRAFT_49023 [Zasmidium cellare ATCC 36951]
MTSVRGSRTVYRERSEERDYEEAPRRSYTTVKRYQVPESITRSVYKDDEEEVKDKIVIKHKHREDPPAPSRHSDDVEYRVTERRWEREPPPPSRVDRDEVDYRFIRTERSADPPRRDISYRVVERDSDYERPRSSHRSEYKFVEKDTEVIRAPSPPSPERVREFRFERDRDYSPARERPYDLEKYSKSTEYFAQPAPQPIIIREPAQQAPIIIREERREPQKIIIRREEPQYEFVERKEVIKEERDESRSLVKKEEPPAPVPVPVPEPEAAKEPEEDYFYERRVVERRRRSDSYDRKTEIRPRDSASNYSSDDSYVYERRERVVEDDKDSHHKRHLAEGAIAGIGAAEILRHHRKRKGEEVGGRAKSAIGGAALGAVGAEALSRARSMRSMRRSRSRSRSDDRHGRRRPRSRSKDRGHSLSRGQQLGGLAAVAAVGALAGYALKNRGNKNETVVVKDGHHRRSRSRRRRGSVDSYYTDDTRRGMSEHRDPEHRNRRIAQAGLASAAAAGIWEKVRSRSRGGRERSKSRIRQGVPIAAAGLGGAALAGLYEKNKANKEAKKDAIIEDEMNRGRRRHSRSRSRSRSVPAPYPADDRRSVDGRPGLIAYGQEPIYPDDRRGYYSDEEPGLYRRRGGSADSSPDTRRRRSRSRGRRAAEMGAAAGVGGLAAHEFGKHRERERSKVEAERRRPDHDEYYNRPYAQDPYSPPPMVDNGYPPYQPNQAYGQQQYPSSNYFPPPPTGDNAQYPEQQSYPTYNPADYANQPPTQQPYDASHGAYGHSDANLGQPYPGDTFAGDTRYGAQDHGRGRGRPDPENVSPPNNDTEKERESQEADGLSTPRQRSTSRVRFDLDSNVAHSPEASRRKDDAKRGDPSEPRQSDTETSDDRKHRRRSKRKGKERERDSHHSHRDEGDDHERRSHDRERNRERDRGDKDDDSDDTVDLPDRFDENGNRKAEDPLAQKINELLGGQGGAGNLFKGLVGGLLGGQGGGGGGEDDDEGRSSRRRHRDRR